jgi:hypothetical protein
VVDERTLALAKYNLQHNFAFVGVTERFAESVHLLERILPVRCGCHSSPPALPLSTPYLSLT